MSSIDPPRRSDAGPTQPAPGPGEPYARWLGWRLRVLAVAALLGCVALALLVRALADTPYVEARWRATREGAVELVSSPLPALAPRVGHVLRAVAGASSAPVPLDALALVASARWLTDDDARRHHAALHAALARVRDDPPVALAFADGGVAMVEPAPRRVSGLGPAFWLVGGLALALYLVGMVVFLAHPAEATLLYAAMAVCQSGSLIMAALELSGAPGLAPWAGSRELPLRTAFDLLTFAAMVHAAAVHPLRLPHAGAIAAAAWAAGLGLSAALALGRVAGSWWWTQAALVAAAAAAALLYGRSHRREPNPAAIVLRRFVVLALAAATLLTIALAATGTEALRGAQRPLARAATAGWTVFLASLLMLLPLLVRQQKVLREFALLAAVTTLATVLDLLLVAAFSLGQFTSLALSLFLTLAVYLAARQWILDQLLGSSVLTAERMFARLYRTVRQVAGGTQEMPQAVAGMLRDLFDPLQVELVAGRPPQAQAGSGGSSMTVPLPQPPDDAPVDAPFGAVALRYAGRGRRLFTADDARLADRLIEQLAIALAYDRAVERGRREERLRIAQDLHDDIGARLLTLMYQAPSPEMEDYLRHTLLDLKTLTRGLAAPPQRLSEAAAEWKADLGQRLTLAGAALSWRLQADGDPLLTVAQWSALTRVLRELTSNAIAHARAQHVEVALRLAGGKLELVVADDGVGGDPAGWSHGLGLSGVRKRVKQLGGEVAWSRATPHGIRCRVTVERFQADARDAAPQMRQGPGRGPDGGGISWGG